MRVKSLYENSEGYHIYFIDFRLLLFQSENFGKINLDKQFLQLLNSSSYAEMGVGASPHIPVLSVCFSCFYMGIQDLLFNTDSERYL